MYSEDLFDENNKTVATAAWYPVETEGGVTTNREANARRLVACWNACDGIPTESIEKETGEYGRVTAVAKRNRDLREERDELLEVLRFVDAQMEADILPIFSEREIKRVVKAAVAKYPKVES